MVKHAQTIRFQKPTNCFSVFDHITGLALKGFKLNNKNTDSLKGKFNLRSSFSNLVMMKLSNPAGNYMFKVNNRNVRTRCEICSKLTVKIPERRQWRRSGIFIVNFEHISHLVLVFLLLTLSR